MGKEETKLFLNADDIILLTGQSTDSIKSAGTHKRAGQSSGYKIGWFLWLRRWAEFASNPLCYWKRPCRSDTSLGQRNPDQPMTGSDWHFFLPAEQHLFPPPSQKYKNLLYPAVFQVLSTCPLCRETAREQSSPKSPNKGLLSTVDPGFSFKTQESTAFVCTDRIMAEKKTFKIQLIHNIYKKKFKHPGTN